MKRIVLAGGSGFIGQALTAALLRRDFEVVVLSRSMTKRRDGGQFAHWDGETVGDWADRLEGAYALVNLAGKTINCRHTAENRRKILASRVNSVRVLGEAVERADQPPKIFVQASGVGIYGDRGNDWCDERTPAGHDFPAEVCRHWENAFAEVRADGMRKVVCRIGIALGPGGGMLRTLSTVTRWFLGGQVSHGRQFISWIHLTDLTRMFLWAIDRDEIAGVFNATSPNPVTNAEFMRELRRGLHRPWSPPVPKFAARIGASLMNTEASLALTGQRCRPTHFLEHGFPFEFPQIRPALQNIYPHL